MMAMHMQMLDQHLHCPTFGTPRLFPQAMNNISGEAATHMRYPAITYPSVLGEPLHGEVINNDLFFPMMMNFDDLVFCLLNSLLPSV